MVIRQRPITQSKTFFLKFIISLIRVKGNTQLTRKSGDNSLGISVSFRTPIIMAGRGE